MEFFGELLAELRKDKKLSQKELADIFHLAASTISSYEMGVHSPHVGQLAKSGITVDSVYLSQVAVLAESTFNCPGVSSSMEMHFGSISI